MCCLFGFVNYSGGKFPGADKLVNCLAQEATERGMDSTGIAYNKNGKLVIYKKPKCAYELEFTGLENCVNVSGHTRHATQGDYMKNYNNHPFMGKCEDMRFALSHNGVLWNDSMLRKSHNIPKDRIETDSYIAVQLLEHFGTFSVENVRKMAEMVSGSFAFSMTDSKDNLWLVKGSSPLAIVHFPHLHLYVYASTENILFTALCRTDLVEDVIAGDFEMVNIRSGDIIQIDKYGQLFVNRFTFYNDYYGCDWRTWNSTSTAWWETDFNQKYLDDLKAVARSMGFDDDDIDELYRDGYTIDEIEDFLYSYN